VQTPALTQLATQLCQDGSPFAVLPLKVGEAIRHVHSVLSAAVLLVATNRHYGLLGCCNHPHGARGSQRSVDTACCTVLASPTKYSPNADQGTLASHSSYAALQTDENTRSQAQDPGVSRVIHRHLEVSMLVSNTASTC